LKGDNDMPSEADINKMLFNQTQTKIDGTQLFEIYKIFVEMTDRINARRQIANSFFLSINIASLALLGHFQSFNGIKHLWFLNVAGILIAWMWINYIKSLKKVNSAKFRVIHCIEEKLTAKAYIAEWQLLTRDPKYKRLSDIETYVPLVFILINIIIVVMDVV